MPRNNDAANQSGNEAEPMPGLIVRQGTIDGESRQQKTAREKILERTSPNNQRAARWVWICTGIITLAIIAVWGYGIMAQLSFFSWSGSSEVKLFKNTKEQWNYFFTQQPADDVSIREEINAALNHIVASSTPAVEATVDITTTTTTSTIETTTSTSF